MKYFSIVCFILIVFSAQAQKKASTLDFESSACTKFEEQLYFNSLTLKGAAAKTYVDSITTCMQPSKALNKTLGKYYYNVSDYSNARTEFNQILKDPSATTNELGESYYYLSLINYYTNKPDLCIQQARQAIEHNYAPSWSNNLIGLALYDKGEYSESAKYHELALQFDPTNYVALNNAGVSYSKMGESLRALRCYQRADSCAKGKVPLYKSNTIRKLVDLKRVDEADVLVKEAYQIFPDSKSIISDYGSYLARQEKYLEALVCGRKLVSLSPSNANQWFEAGHLFDEAGVKDTAFLYYNIALRYNPNMSGALQNLGIIYRTFGKFDQAEKMIDAALAIDSSYKHFQSKVSLYVWKKDFENALLWSRLCYRRYPDTKSTNLNLGYVLMESKKYEEAIPYLKRVLVVNPKDDRALNNLGRCYAQVKQSDSAFVYFTRALTVNANNSYIYHNRAALYCDLQQYDLACADLATAIDKEYNWTIDEKLETMKKTYCPNVNTNRKVLINEYKGNMKELSRFNFIELSDSQLASVMTTQLKLIEQDSVYRLAAEKSTNVSFDSFKIYPNPSSGEFYLEGPEGIASTLIVRIIDEKGTLVYTDVMKEALKKIELKNVPNGIYVLTVKTEQALVTAKKLVIEK